LTRAYKVANVHPIETAADCFARSLLTKAGHGERLIRACRLMARENWLVRTRALACLRRAIKLAMLLCAVVGLVLIFVVHDSHDFDAVAHLEKTPRVLTSSFGSWVPYPPVGQCKYGVVGGRCRRAGRCRRGGASYGVGAFLDFLCNWARRSTTFWVVDDTPRTCHHSRVIRRAAHFAAFRPRRPGSEYALLWAPFDWAQSRLNPPRGLSAPRSVVIPRVVVDTDIAARTPTAPSCVHRQPDALSHPNFSSNIADFTGATSHGALAPRTPFIRFAIHRTLCAVVLTSPVFRPSVPNQINLGTEKAIDVAFLVIEFSIRAMRAFR
jgi:hypothetical protein